MYYDHEAIPQQRCDELVHEADIRQLTDSLPQNQSGGIMTTRSEEDAPQGWFTQYEH